MMYLISVAFVLAIASCSPTSTNMSPSVSPAATFSASGTAPLEDRWWQAFADPQLDRLVAMALNRNFSLEAAWHRLAAARATVDREKAPLWPDLEGAVTGGIDRGATDDESLRIGVASSYELDLWGKLRAAAEAERHRYQATGADYQTAALALAAEVARTWYGLMDARSQLELFERQIETNAQVLSLIRARFGSGQVRSVDILRQRQLLESTREGKIGVQARVALLEHRLAVLLGRAPREAVAYEPGPLPEVPPLPATGLPVQLIQRRPDVQSAFSQLRAADRDLAVALANRYPRLTFAASATSTNTGGGFEEWARNLTAGLLAPIFNAGALDAEARRRRALKDERLSAYGQAILSAWREVEDALSQEQRQAERIRSIEAQVGLARQTYEQLRLEYLNGISGYLDVLTALTDEQRLRRGLISEKLVLLEYRIALYRALAGGFEVGRDDTLGIKSATHRAG